MKHWFLFIFLLLTSLLQAQEQFTRADSLKGSITPERAWWDVRHYNLAVSVDPAEKKIIGSNIIKYEVLSAGNVMQIDLQAPMQIESVEQNAQKLNFTSEGDFHFIKLEEDQEVGKTYELLVFFSGKPKVARRPPWDGGISWTKDNHGNDWVVNANQGIGASVWWPLKDHPYDEPNEGMLISVTAPKALMNVSNGRLKEVMELKDSSTWTWEVVNPINAYGVNLSIGDYLHFGEKYKGEKGFLDLDYYVLRDYKDKAQEQFKQVPKMIEAFEHWFGPYPFYEDGFKLIHVPYLGMEHQSAVTYGNNFENGYLGKDLSGSGWGMKFDFIIIHESGHEWFANNITNNDVADMWIHEGFTCYSENLYLDYHYGKKAASEYVIGLRQNIVNDRPLIGHYGVNNRGSSDIYYKGANILHTLRQVIDNDKKWRKILRGLNKEFRHQTVSSRQIETYITRKSGKNLQSFWNQYLRTTQIPVLQYRITENQLSYRYIEVVDNFEMPLEIQVNGRKHWLKPSADWQIKKISGPIEEVLIKEDFYIISQSLSHKKDDSKQFYD